MKLLQNFGYGILWALLTPFLLVAIALVAIYGVGVFAVEFVLMIVHFFQGKKLFPVLEEDERAAAILQREIDAAQTPAQQQVSNNSTVMIQQNYFNGAYPPGAYPQMPYPGQQGYVGQQGYPGQPGYPGAQIPAAANPGQLPPAYFQGNPALPNAPMPELQSLPQANSEESKEEGK